MILLTRDPSMMRRAGLFFLLLGPACAFNAWVNRDSGTPILAVSIVLGVAGVLGGIACLRRADALKRGFKAESTQGRKDANTGPTKQQLQNASKTAFFLFPLWLAFGAFYGVVEDNPVVTVVAVIMTVMQVSIGFYAKKRAERR